MQAQLIQGRLLSGDRQKMVLDNIRVSEDTIYVKGVLSMFTSQVQSKDTYILETAMGTRWKQGVHVKLGESRKTGDGWSVSFNVLPSD